MDSQIRMDVSHTTFLSLSLFLMMYVCIGISSDSEAKVVAGNVLKSKELGPTPHLKKKNTDILRAPQRWERRLFSVPLPQQTIPKHDLQWKNGPNFSLKDPGVLPGIQFGVEMHSFQALQSVIPEETLPKGIQPNQDRPLLVPPSINAPDYNGGFLRFTW
jgi:hypothetical protein